MAVLIAIITALGVAALWIWRMRMAADTAREVIDVADDVRAALRRFGYRRHPDRHPADAVEDPRLAAAGMLAAIARIDGDLTAAQIDAIRVECRASFRVDQKEADDIAAYGRWLASQSGAPDDALRRLARRLADIAPGEARVDLLTMMRRIAEVEGGVSSEQHAALSQARLWMNLAN